jgi:hypothetical protein
VIARAEFCRRNYHCTEDMAAPAPRRGTFAFDLSRPLKKGTLLKQGAFHKAFKARAFILYPGFLVYYESESKWRLDLTKGETLGVSARSSQAGLTEVAILNEVIK